MSTPAAIYRNAVDLNRFSNGVAKRIAITYNDLIVDAVNQLQTLDEFSAPARAARLRDILAQLKQSLDGWAEASTALAVEELQGLSLLQSEFVEDQLRKALPLEMRDQIRSIQISPQFAQSVATVDPTAINVVALSDDLQAAVTGAPATFQLTATQGTMVTLPNGKVLAKAFRGLAESQADLFAMTVRNGLLAGESTDEMARRLKGRLQFGDYGPLSVRQLAQAGGQVTSVANHQVMALVRTSVNQVANASSQQVYEANQSVTKRYRYIATLDGRTSPICRALDGQEFDYGKGPIPPQHFNCRSTTVPLIDYEGLGIPPPKPGKRRSKDGLVPENQTYGQWLHNQSKETKADILGPEKVPYFDQLAKKYGPSDAIRKFVSRDGSEKTLDDLRRIYGPASKINAKPKPTAKVKPAPTEKTQSLKEKLATSKAKTAKAKADAAAAATKAENLKNKLLPEQLLAAKQKEFKELNQQLFTAPKSKLKAVEAKAKTVKAEIEELKIKDPVLAALEKKKKALEAKLAKTDKLLAKSKNLLEGKKTPLTAAEKAAKPPRAAIKSYTGSDFSEIRAQQFREAQEAGEKLTGYEKSQISIYKKNARFSKKAKDIEAYLKRAPKYEGDVFRTMVMPQENLDELIVGFKSKSGTKTLAMESWTANEDLEFSQGIGQRVLLRTKNKKGVDVSRLSEFESEEEVLMPKGSRYKLKGITKEEISKKATKEGRFRWIIDVEQL